MAVCLDDPSAGAPAGCTASARKICRLKEALIRNFEAGAGDILVIKAGEIHGFRCIGEGPLVQVDVHLSPHFIQENLT